MIAYSYAPDLCVVSSLSAGFDYNLRQSIPFTKEYLQKYTTCGELAIASITESQKGEVKAAIIEDDWKELGWYPSLHGPYKTIYAVYVYAKVLKEKGLYSNISNQIQEAGSGAGLGCSVGLFTGKVPRISVVEDYPGGRGYGGNDPGQKRITIWRWPLEYGPTKTKFSKLGFRKFATTSLAEYFIFALKPGESR